MHSTHDLKENGSRPRSSRAASSSVEVHTRLPRTPLQSSMRTALLVVIALLASAHIMVLPTAFEGLANAWVESLACGTPVVTCDVGGAREAIDRRAAGRLVARTSESVAAGIADLLADYPAQADVREAAERFSWEANAAALEAHLVALVAR